MPVDSHNPCKRNYLRIYWKKAYAGSAHLMKWDQFCDRSI